jgi:hypothetical protein
MKLVKTLFLVVHKIVHSMLTWVHGIKYGSATIRFIIFLSIPAEIHVQGDIMVEILSFTSKVLVLTVMYRGDCY